MHPRGGKRAQQGFTLIEIVVSLLIFAVLSVLAWQGLYQMVQLDERSRTQVQRQNEINLAWAVLMKDLLHMRARPVRDRFGDMRPAFMAPAGDYLAEWTRGGLPLIPGLLPNGMQRVAYELTGTGELVRHAWTLMDGYGEQQLQSRTLLAGVAGLRMEYLDSRYYFQPTWPPLNEEAGPYRLPPMVRFQLDLPDGLGFTRLVPGVQTLEPEVPGDDGEGS